MVAYPISKWHCFDICYAICQLATKDYKLYVLIMSRTHFRVNPHSIVAWLSRNSLLETGAISEVDLTRLEPTTTLFVNEHSTIWSLKDYKHIIFKFALFWSLSVEILACVMEFLGLVAFSTSIQRLFSVGILLFFRRTSFWVNNSRILLLNVWNATD